MERAQRQSATLEKQREVLQQSNAAASPRAAPHPAPSSALEDSLRKELQAQVLSLDLGILCRYVTSAVLQLCLVLSNVQYPAALRRMPAGGAPSPGNVC